MYVVKKSETPIKNFPEKISNKYFNANFLKNTNNLLTIFSPVCVIIV